MTNSLSKMDQEFQESKNKINDLTLQLSQSKEQAEAKITSLEDQLKNKIEELESQKQKSESEILEKQNLVDELQNKFTNEALNLNKEQQELVESYKNDIEDLRTDMKEQKLQFIAEKTKELEQQKARLQKEMVGVKKAHEEALSLQKEKYDQYVNDSSGKLHQEISQNKLQVGTLQSKFDEEKATLLKQGVQLQDQVESLELEIRDANQANRDLSSEVKQLKKQVSDLKSQKKILQKKFEELKSSTDKKKNEIENQLAESLLISQNFTQQNTDQIQKMEQEIKNLESDKKDQKTRITSLQTDIVSAQDEQEALKGKLAKYKNKEKEINQKINTLKSENKQTEEEKEELTNKISDLQKTLEESKQEIDTLRKEKEEIEEELQTQISELMDSSIQDKQTIEETIKVTQTQISELENQNTMLDQQIDQLKKQNESEMTLITDQKQKTESMVKELNSDIEQLQDKLFTLQEEKVKQDEEYLELKSQNDELTQKLKNYKSDKKAIESDTQNELEKERETNKILENRIIEKNTEIIRIQEGHTYQVDKDQKERIKLEKRIKDLQQKIKGKENEENEMIETMKISLKELNQQISDQEDKSDELKKMEGMNQDLQSQMKKLEVQIKDLSTLNQEVSKVATPSKKEISKEVEALAEDEGLEANREEYCQLMLQNLSYKLSNSSLKTKLFIKVLNILKMDSNEKDLEKQNLVLNGELMQQTEKLIEIQMKRDELDQQLEFREAQLEEVICSSSQKTISDAQRSLSSSQISQSQNGNDTQFRNVLSHLKALLVLISKFYDFESPPLDRINDKKAWEKFLKELKTTMREEQGDHEMVQENLQSLKQMLNIKSLEAEENTKNFKSKQPPYIPPSTFSNLSNLFRANWIPGQRNLNF